MTGLKKAKKPFRKSSIMILTLWMINETDVQICSNQYYHLEAIASP